jgi:chemotaxis protein methyltransferase CheR
MEARELLPDALLAELSEYVAQHIGLHFPPERRRDLERGIAAAAPDLGHPDAVTCARALLSAPLAHARIEVLASHLTVGETYFFRDGNTFAALEEHVLPGLLRARAGAERRIRIWSAGCCTGEEPYSIAMVLDRLIPEPETWNITILATDINPRFLRKAAEGVYGEWSFRGTPAPLRERYFIRRRDGRFELQPRIRRQVIFSHLNLADDTYPSLASNTNAMDVILCRNVLMYFTPERARRVALNFQRALVGGGWLIVSPTETSNALFAPLSPVQSAGALFYRKGAGAAAPQPIADQEHFPAPQASFTQEAPASRSEIPEVTAALKYAPRPREATPESADCARSARLCADSGRLGEAAGWCERAIAAERLNPAHYFLLASIRQEQGEFEAAAQALSRALYLDPDFALAHFSLGNLRLLQRRRRDAERHFANALSVLRGRAEDEILAESEGLTAGRLAEIIASVRAMQPRAAA